MVFCDYLSMYQDHYGVDLPRINNGCIWAVDADGEIQWTTEAKFEHIGSYETKIRIKCDGNRVTVDGNISRFNRPDNVFGFSVRDCVTRYNKLLESFGLPPFTAQGHGTRGSTISPGAIITRVDLTKNYSCGSRERAIRLIHFLAGQDSGRRASVKQYGDYGVTWNEGSQYWYGKFYLKEESVGETITPHMAQWVKEQGIGRHEVSLKARYLAQKNLRHIHQWEEADMDNIVYGRFTDVLTRGTACRSPIEDIEGRAGLAAMAWLAGKDVWGDESYSKRTRQRIRRELLPYGIDIKQPSSIARIKTRVDVIELQAVQAPAWYWNKAA